MTAAARSWVIGFDYLILTLWVQSQKLKGGGEMSRILGGGGISEEPSIGKK